MTVTGRVTTADPLPIYMERLPLDEVGRPIPWFVGIVDGKPDFRVVEPDKRAIAVKVGLCWVCGQALGSKRVYAIGPMCAVNRVTAEPPNHPACAHWSVRNCPFLANPDRGRRDGNVPDNIGTPGIAIERNPGVTCLWMTRKFKRVADGGGSWLIQLGDPQLVEWWRCGREATRAEVEASIDSGLPILREMAEAEGPGAVRDLERYVERARPYLPAA